MENLKFDLYQVFGVICPGAIVIFGLSFVYPKIGEFIQANMSIFGIGLFALAAYVSGNLIQSFGNLIELLWWKTQGGKPTRWILKKHCCKAIPECYRDDLLTKVKYQFGGSYPDDFTSFKPGEWDHVVRLMTTVVKNRGRDGRLFVFNAMYGLNRGIASSLLFVLLLLVTKDFVRENPLVLIALGVMSALYRMHRFSVNYTKELFSQFLNLRDSGD